MIIYCTLVAAWHCQQSDRFHISRSSDITKGDAYMREVLVIICYIVTRGSEPLKRIRV